MTDEPRPENLSIVDLEILELLWYEWFSGGEGLTRAQLLERLTGKVRHTKAADGNPATVPLVRTDAALRPHLVALSDAGEAGEPVRVTARRAQTNAPGGKPATYKIAVDSIITWPSTAFMLVELAKTRPSVEREVFIEWMLNKKVVNSSTRKIATGDEISRQLQTAADWGYISFVNQSVISASDRLRFELDYLKFVASHLK